MSASLEDTSPFNDSNHENNQDGGKVLIGPDDGNVYLAVDVGSREGQAQNVKDGDPFDGSSCILGAGQNGEAVSDNPLVDGGQETQNDDIEEWDGASALTGRYYAYGIRNSFGMDFDPVTGKTMGYRKTNQPKTMK